VAIVDSIAGDVAVGVKKGAIMVVSTLNIFDLQKSKHYLGPLRRRSKNLDGYRKLRPNRCVPRWWHLILETRKKDRYYNLAA